MSTTTYVFTVSSTSEDKPIIWAQLTSSKAVKNQKAAEALIYEFAAEYFEDETTDNLEDLAYKMRHDGYAWFNEDICFELTVVNG